MIDGDVFHSLMDAFSWWVTKLWPTLSLCYTTLVSILYTFFSNFFADHIFFLFFTRAAEYYDNGHCHACHSTCETCKGPTEGDCLTCASPLLLQRDKCVSTCDEGYYMEAGVCAKCLHTCTQCVSRMNCTSCAKGLQLQSGECRTTCAEGWVIKNARYKNIGHCFVFVSFFKISIVLSKWNWSEGQNRTEFQIILV